MEEKMEHKEKELNEQKPDVNYWRSFEELYGNKETLEKRHHEFFPGASDAPDINNMSGLSRRKFLALLGASAALAGAGCSDYRDKGEIIPYNKKPEEITLGKPNFYASTCTYCSSACGILIKTREGRPIKVDGNPDHPVSKGKICARGQAAILNLYDPQRIQDPLYSVEGYNFSKVSWNDADSKILAALNSSAMNGKEIAILTNTVFSPTLKKLLEDFTSKFSTTKVYSYEVFDDVNRVSAWQKTYGTSTFPVIKWNNAKVILSLEADFLGSDGNRIENSRLFAETRDVDNINKFSRLYVVEGNMSLTGINADYRFRLNPSFQHDFVMTLLNEVIKKNVSSISIDETARQTLSQFSLSAFAQKSGMVEANLKQLVEDLVSNKGKGIVYAGKALSEETHIAVNLLNEVLGNNALYDTKNIHVELVPYSSNEELMKLTNSMKNGNVGVVIHLDSNPVFELSPDFGYAEALKKVNTKITLTELPNESGHISNFVLPINHNFESWGDAKTRTGFYSLQQPVIAPIFNSRQKEGIILNWLNGGNYSETAYHEYLKSNWQNIYFSLNSLLDFPQFWNTALHDGVAVSNDSASLGSLQNSAWSSIQSNRKSNGGYSLVLAESLYLGNGKFASNGWLQELPHPVSKMCWDNYASISEATAKELGVKNNDYIKVSNGENSLEIPVFIQAGVADKTVTIELGYGRTNSGIVASGVGFNSNKLLNIKNGLSKFLSVDVSVQKGNGSYKLVTAQEHYAFDNELTKGLAEKRHIIQEGTVLQFLKNPNFIQEGTNFSTESIYKDHPYEGLKWGMAIDLNKCTGCTDCVAACNVENNIPIVGKDQVANGRELHWLRIDRYYSGGVNEPKVSLQPMLCQHCDKAPCEQVCPVVATTHSPDGLNQMVYNRCVGTRYCSNNCPYKVRRFNYYNFRDRFRDGYQEEESFTLMHNPEVTVRSRGVMEKCTFCIQRIMDAREEAIRTNRQLKGSDVHTACQDACPTSAISFGDINDLTSDFNKMRNHKLGYYVLEELNVRPNVTYIAKLRNTHSEEN